ncbi:MAG: glycosyltransferase, partial [Kiritimatiellia bacterium]
MARNIVFFTERFEEFGGREIFLSALLRALQAAGHRCTLVCQRTRNSLLAELAASGARLLSRPRLIDGTGPPFGISILPALASIMREADVLIFTRPVSPFCFRIGRFLARVESNPKLIFLTTIRPAEAWRRRRWPPGLLDHFDAVITQSPAFQSDLRRYGYKGAIHVIPYLMPDVAPVCPFPSLERTVRLGFLGRLVPEKNLEYLFEVILALIRGSTRSTSVSYEFHIFGDGPHRTQCERLVRKLRLEDLVIFHGFLPHAQIFSSIDTCHLFLFAPYTAGQCLAALEVLSRGRPMVATAA